MDVLISGLSGLADLGALWRQSDRPVARAGDYSDCAHRLTTSSHRYRG